MHDERRDASQQQHHHHDGGPPRVAHQHRDRDERRDKRQYAARVRFLQPPLDDALLTGQQWIDHYLLPLANTALLKDHLRLHTIVTAVGKDELLKGDMPGHEDRGDWSFRVLFLDATGAENVELFDGPIRMCGEKKPLMEPTRERVRNWNGLVAS